MKFQKTLHYTAKNVFTLKTVDTQFSKHTSNCTEKQLFIQQYLPVHLYNMPVMVPAATVLRSSSAPRVFSMMTPNALQSKATGEMDWSVIKK